VVVNDHARRRHPVSHATQPSGSGRRRCLGRRRYTVGGTSTFGGFFGIGFRGCAALGARFLATLGAPSAQ
jgi:hypothetical protein